MHAYTAEMMNILAVQDIWYSDRFTDFVAVRCRNSLQCEPALQALQRALK